MYKGNMYEFVDKVSEYVMEKKNRLITFRINDNPWLFKGEYYLTIWQGSTMGNGTSYPTYDREDFEEQVIEIINKYIKE